MPAVRNMQRVGPICSAGFGRLKSSVNRIHVRFASQILPTVFEYLSRGHTNKREPPHCSRRVHQRGNTLIPCMTKLNGRPHAHEEKEIFHA